jgi:hypothetical protein
MNPQTKKRVLAIINSLESPVPLPQDFNGANGWIEETKAYALDLLQQLNYKLHKQDFNNIELLISEIERLFEAGRQLRATQ